MHNSYLRSFCNKTYKKVKSSKKDIQSVHKEDVRKHRDNDRIIRLYKFLLVYFKNDGRTSAI